MNEEFEATISIYTEKDGEQRVVIEVGQEDFDRIPAKNDEKYMIKVFGGITFYLK